MYQEFAAVLTGLNSLKTLLVAANQLANHNEIVAAVSEVNTKMMDAQAVAIKSIEKELSQASRIRELEEEITGLKAWKTDANRYELAAFSADVFAYRLKESMGNGEPAHWICSKCFQESKKGHLNFHSETHYRITFACVACGAEYRRPSTKGRPSQSAYRDG